MSLRHLFILLTISSVTSYKPCSEFGYNWAAEIRCLRSMLAKCQDSAPNREPRTISESKPSHSRYPMLPRVTSTLTTVPPSVNMDAIVRNVTQQCEWRMSQMKERMEMDMNRRITEMQSKLENEMRLSESRMERKVADVQRQLETDIKKLAKRVELLSARVYHHGKFEYIVMKDRESWYRAEEICLQWGGHLPSVASNEENEFLASLLEGEPAWIGFNDVQLENAFINTDRVVTTYRNWIPGQPDNSNHNENCVEMGRTGQWTDILCLLRRPFFCKR